ncbi:MAG: hypothetical protein LBH98_00940 [Chitinispirillales bacterium]|jgi:hypothetical protein|nr:hypothetical protein [Chitinispirillales bacterium]
MLLDNIYSTNYFSQTNSVKKEFKDLSNAKQAAKKTAFEHDDYYTPSIQEKSVESVKAKNLSEIKNRINSGFYNSQSVNDDLTEVFTEIFKKTFS